MLVSQLVLVGSLVFGLTKRLIEGRGVADAVAVKPVIAEVLGTAMMMLGEYVDCCRCPG